LHLDAERSANLGVLPHVARVLAPLPTISPKDSVAVEALLPDYRVAAYRKHRLEQ
jgi:hypothetical protein